MLELTVPADNRNLGADNDSVAIVRVRHYWAGVFRALESNIILLGY